MELNAWIDSKAPGTHPGKAPGKDGARAVAVMLQENPRTVYSWYCQERAPCFRSAMKIVQASCGAVDYNGIFEPLARAQPSVTAHDRG